MKFIVVVLWVMLISVPRQRRSSPAVERQPCFNMLRSGRCSRGDMCRYSHDVRSQKRPNCKLFWKNRCSRGDSCWYRHPSPERYHEANKAAESFMTWHSEKKPDEDATGLESAAVFGTVFQAALNQRTKK